MGWRPNYWTEIDGGDAVRQIEEYPNGNVISYDSSYPTDEHGALAEAIIYGDETWWEEFVVTQEEFERIWRAHRPINREFPIAARKAD